MGKNDNFKAIQSFQKAIEINPKSILAYCYAAQLYAKIDLRRYAKENFNQCLNLKVNNDIDYEPIVVYQQKVAKQIIRDLNY